MMRQEETVLSDIPAALQHRCVFITETDVFGYNLLPQAAAHLVAMRAYAC